MPVATSTNAEPIPGYTLKDRLGAGGYGEVWSCEAPGGLIKAIKFVYGYLDEHRAARELKALNRVKQLRHPFLLSLERIEVVDGQLLIVTELAESNLKERFDACLKAGLPGIPREELLIYLGDAADALDFMVDQHSLQHLDVKPENLLLVGSRVKVADFGLVKEVHDVTASLMGGLTPLYAPPEVFDNRPSRQSDQYSLAIVFQEMLTGVLPFPGTTAAQLATQHLNSRPRLGALPERDQPSIAKALEKDPLRRFASCRELVHSLIEASKANVALPPAAGLAAHAAPGAPSNAPGGAPEGNKGQNTEAMAAVRQSAPRAARMTGSLSRTSSQAEVTALPPVDLSSAEPVLRPTVFVGCGGVAGSVLKHLRRRLFARFGDPSRTPSLRMLLIDADAKSAMRAAQGDGAQGLLPHETLIAPLRRTQSYRDSSAKLLKWISRRWLYNIPKSMLTEGMRPLGRLALADHAELLHEKLTRSIEEAQSNKALQTTGATLGLKSAGAPRVVVIASTSGGAGSGMALDVGYMARQAFQEIGLAGEVLGLLAHGTGRLVAARELALANSFACLAELNHYSLSFTGYPGDPACRLPAFPPGVAPFDTTYVNFLGDDLNDDGFEAAADRLAAYLYLDAATMGGLFLAASRRGATEAARSQQRAAGKNEAPPEIVVRSFGLCQIDGSQDDVLAAAIDVVCRGVCLRWRGSAELIEPTATSELPEFHIAHQRPKPANEVDTQDIERFGQELADGLELQVDPLVARVNTFVDGNLGSDSATYFRQILAPLFPSTGKMHPQDFRATRVEETLATLDSLLGAGVASEAVHEVTQEHAHSSFYKTLVAQVDALAAERGRVMRESVLGLLDRSKLRAAGAVALAEWYARRLQELEGQVRDLSQRLAGEWSRLEQQLPGRQAAAGKPRAKASFADEPKLTNEWRERLFHYAQLRMAVLVARAAARFTQVLRTEVGAIEHAVKTLKRDLSHLENEFRVGAWNAAVANAAADSVKATIVAAIRARLGDLTNQIDRHCSQEMFAGQSPLRLASEKKLDFEAGFADRLRGAARTGLAAVMRDIDLSAALMKDHSASVENGDGGSKRLASLFAAAHPKLLEAGGEQRMLLVLPEGSSETSLRESIASQFGQPPTVVYDSDRDATFCQEARGLSLSRVAAAIVGHRPEYAQAAQRLHTRTDVEWTAMD